MTFKIAVNIGTLALLLAPVEGSTAEADASIVLSLPLACEFGKSCFIQQYFDHDPSKNASDYRCGPMTYDGHDGVDLRVPSLQAQRRGVTVVAAAAGTVRGVRDGMADVNVRIAGPDSVRGRECGNGVVLVHPEGWETQYCHMAKGSVRVKNGQRIEAGSALGLVGMSGDAEFPHLHFSVRHSAAKIDPFAVGAASGTCGGGRSLWSKSAAAALAYHSPDVINTGFASQTLTMDDIESGRMDASSVASDAPMLVAFVRAIGLKAGDVQMFTLRDPLGAVLARNESAPLDRNMAQRMEYIGKRRTSADWPRGKYEAQYEVRRGGATTLMRRFDFELR